jgi:DNA-binding NarL/FixJ family response regulator
MSAVERGRAAFGGRAWADARRLLAEAAAEGELAAEDLERLAVAAYLVGEDDQSALAWERAHLACLHAEQPAEAARCAFWLGLALLLQGEEARAGGWLARGRRLVEEGELDCVAAGYLLVPEAIGTLESGDPAGALAIYTEVGEIADRFDDENLRALAWLGRGEALIALGEPARGVALLDELMIAVTTGEVAPILAGIVHCAVIDACIGGFDLRRAGEWTEALGRWCDRQPDLVPFRGHCLVHRSQVLQAHGEWTEAVLEARRAGERLSQPPHPALGLALYQQGELHRLRGELAEAEEAYRQASRLGLEPVPGLALLRLAQGRVDAAVAAVRRLVGERQDPLHRSAVLAADVEIELAAGEVGVAQASADELTALAADVGAPLLDALAAYASGSVQLAADDAAAALVNLRRALAAWQAAAMPYDAARARVLIGVACRALGDEDGAAMELDAARAELDRLGAAPDLARVEALAAPAPARSSAVLTSRECEVLRLVAAGRTNREIGSALFISEHTVARHLQNIFTKLGLSSRSAATAYAYEHHLV